MNVGVLQAIAELIVVTIPVIIAGTGGLLLLSRSRLGEALASRVAGDTRDPACEEQLEALQDEVVALRNQLSEMQERVDFFERLLGSTSRA